MIFISDTNSFALLAFFGSGPYMAWLFLILAVIILGLFLFLALKIFGPYYLALLACYLGVSFLPVPTHFL